MKPQQVVEFEDPALKQAVCRCWASECASAMLRQRVADLFDETEEVSIPSKSGRRFNRFAWMIWPSALAALLLISVGVFNHFHSTPIQTAVAIPINLENDLISTHDHCCSATDHQHLDVSRTDDFQIGKALIKKLHRAVIVYHPADVGWVFRGASVCPVGEIPSGHLVFVKGGEPGEVAGTGAFSIFSLPKSMMPNAHEGVTYSATVNHHAIVGFVKNDALFCLVSSGTSNSFSIDELKKMQSEMQPTIATLPPRAVDGIVLTELLQPVR